MSVDVSSKTDKEAIRAALDGAAFDTPYGKDFQRFLRHGIGIHHAGLLPKYRLLVESWRRRGCSRSSAAPTRWASASTSRSAPCCSRSCASSTARRRRSSGVREFLQIAGRAGRKGFDDRGFVVAQAPEHVVENRRLAAKQAQGKKVVMHKPPTKGYVHWDRGTFERLRDGTPEPLESRFDVTHGVLLSCLQRGRHAGEPARGGGYRRLVSVIARSHSGPRQKREQRRRAAACFRPLRHAGIIDVVPTEAVRGRVVEVSGELQLDFSLHHTLSLFLIDATALLDRESPTYALTCCRWSNRSSRPGRGAAQAARSNQDREDGGDEGGGRRIRPAHRRARRAGVAEAEPRPHLRHVQRVRRSPPVGRARERAAEVRGARDVRGLRQLRRLRARLRPRAQRGRAAAYLSQVYRTLNDTVPMAARTEAVMDIAAHFRTLLRDVDTSLLDEWELLAHPIWRSRPRRRRARRGRRSIPSPSGAPCWPPFAPSCTSWCARSRAATTRRRRGSCSRATTVKRGRPSGLEAAMAPFFAAHAELLTTPDARRPDRTRIDDLDAGRLRAQQALIDPEGDEDWSLDCVADVKPGAPPRLALTRIGV
jgi:hypothetical protein